MADSSVLSPVTAPSPCRPWWKKKRWWAGLGLWLLVAYPLSLGPMNYAQGRGWISRAGNAWMQTFYDPLAYLAVNDIPPGGLILAYADWFGDLADEHASSD